MKGGIDLNAFIDYLNSMNNADANNINALAESQVTSEYYDAIRVDRKLGNFIIDKINKGEHHCFIITGHAGDGKTSILAQVLKNLSLIEAGEKLKEHAVITKGTVNLEYIKDMSELSEEQQIQYLEEGLNAPSKGRSSIIISNTGPLMKGFRKFISGDNNKLDDIENQLLAQLDENKCEELCIDDYKFYLVNIARIENIDFADKIIEKICNDNLWKDCEGCSEGDICPMLFNKQCVSRNIERVKEFVKNFYLWLQENDKRVTIRQIISQISYAFTGNEVCSQIKKKRLTTSRNYKLFNYNFANLFFGYKGITKVEEASQIRGIKLLGDLALDQKTLAVDYDLFVEEKFNCFDEQIQDLIRDVWDAASMYLEGDNEDMDAISLQDYQQQVRRAIRRFYMIFSVQESEQECQNLYSQIYNKNFMNYCKGMFSKLGRGLQGYFQTLIFEALYIQNIGMPPEDDDNLYLTLRKNNSAPQGVLLLLGKGLKSDFSIKQLEKDTTIEDIEKKNILVLRIKNKEEFELSLPLINYFQTIVEGEISTDLNPALSHGLSELNALLLKTFRKRSSEDEVSLKIVVNTNVGIKPISLVFEDEDGKIYIE